MLNVTERFWILIILAVISNDAFWEILRAFISFREYNAWIYLLEIAVSIFYFYLVSRWDGTIKYFGEFKEKHPRYYRILFGIIKLINLFVCGLLYVTTIITVVLSAPESNREKYMIEERTKAKEKFLDYKKLVVDNTKNSIVIAFCLPVCLIILWVLNQYKVLSVTGLKYIACVCNILILCISVKFITNGYSNQCKINDKNGLGN